MAERDAFLPPEMRAKERKRLEAYRPRRYGSNKWAAGTDAHEPVSRAVRKRFQPVQVEKKLLCHECRPDGRWDMNTIMADCEKCGQGPRHCVLCDPRPYQPRR